MKSGKSLAFAAFMALAGISAGILSGCASVSSAIVPGERFVPMDDPGSVYAVGQIIEMDSSRVDMVYDPKVPSDLLSVEQGDLPALSRKTLMARYSSIAKDAMEDAGAKLGDVKVAVSYLDPYARAIPTYSLYRHIQDQMTKNAELRSMILNYAAVGARFEVISLSVHGRLVLTVTDAMGKSLELEPAVLAAAARGLNVRFTRDGASSAYVSENALLGFYADRRMVRALTSAAGSESQPAAKAAK